MNVTYKCFPYRLKPLLYTFHLSPNLYCSFSRALHYLMCCAAMLGVQLGVYGSPCPHLDSTLRKAPVCLSTQTQGARELIGSGSSVLTAASPSADPDLCLRPKTHRPLVIKRSISILGSTHLVRIIQSTNAGAI